MVNSVSHGKARKDYQLPVAARRKVVPTDGDVRVFLLQYSRILLKYLLVTSGVAVHEPDGRAHELGQLGLGNVLLADT